MHYLDSKSSCCQNASVYVNNVFLSVCVYKWAINFKSHLLRPFILSAGVLIDFLRCSLLLLMWPKVGYTPSTNTKDFNSFDSINALAKIGQVDDTWREVSVKVPKFVTVVSYSQQIVSDTVCKICWALAIAHLFCISHHKSQRFSIKETVKV